MKVTKNTNIENYIEVLVNTVPCVCHTKSSHYFKKERN